MGILIFFAVLFFIAVALIKGHNEASSGHQNSSNGWNEGFGSSHSSFIDSDDFIENSFTDNSSSLNSSSFLDDTFTSSSTDINPATGLPMVSDYGIDVGGNVYGTNNDTLFDDSLSSGIGIDSGFDDSFSSSFDDSFSSSGFDDSISSSSSFDDSFSSSSFDDSFSSSSSFDDW